MIRQEVALLVFIMIKAFSCLPQEYALVPVQGAFIVMEDTGQVLQVQISSTLPVHLILIAREHMPVMVGGEFGQADILVNLYVLSSLPNSFSK